MKKLSILLLIIAAQNAQSAECKRNQRPTFLSSLKESEKKAAIALQKEKADQEKQVIKKRNSVLLSRYYDYRDSVNNFASSCYFREIPSNEVAEHEFLKFMNLKDGIDKIAQSFYSLLSANEYYNIRLKRDIRRMVKHVRIGCFVSELFPQIEEGVKSEKDLRELLKEHKSFIASFSSSILM